MMRIAFMMAAAAALTYVSAEADTRCAALDARLWAKSEWISAADAKVLLEKKPRGVRAADGTSCFAFELTNEAEVKSAKWMTTGLGVYTISVNGAEVGDDALKPGFTKAKATRRSYTYDVSDMLKKAKGETNAFSAQVSAGWWRDKIVNFAGRKSAFRAVLQVTYADGTVKEYGTNTTDWKAGVGGPVLQAGIYDGEEYDARAADVRPTGQPVRNNEFKGAILPSEGGEIAYRFDRGLSPVAAYAWKGVDGADEKKAFGRVRKLRDGFRTLAPGETLIVDFGQNAAAVPLFEFSAKEGTKLTCLPAEMLNDANGEHSRGNDGPGGSAYRANLRTPDTGMRLVYTFGKSDSTAKYMPKFTFFGYRYLSITATDDVKFSSITSVPVTSITKDMELGRLETGVGEVNKLISNVFWGQLSNYLSVPTDCPQRNERLGWTADTQVFAEAGAFNADTSAFMRKWMRDMRDSQSRTGSFPGAAPIGPYGGSFMRLGWTDAGVIVPYQMWKQFGDTKIIDENWSAMEKFMSHVSKTKFAFSAIGKECGKKQYGDWLSFEPLETCGRGIYVPGTDKLKPEAIVYWDYLGACYWAIDAEMMSAMAAARGRTDAARHYAADADAAKAHLRKEFFTADGKFKLGILNTMQTPALFALKLGLVDGDAKAGMVAALKKNFKDHGDCLQTGFLGTSILMETLSENGMSDLAYTLLLQRNHPSWLYSVDQGATTIWERWNSYTIKDGFGPVSMNSFNHYAYGAVLAWMYKDMAGIAADPKSPGFKNIIMAPKPDRRMGFVKAEYKSSAGVVKSHWRYEGDKWIWDFTIPPGATADVTLPGQPSPKKYSPGTYRLEKLAAGR